MATTVPIPTTTLQTGPTTVGPVTVTTTVSAALSIDRTVAGGLNSLTNASTLAVEVDGSNDGGNTWTLIVGSVFSGGLIPLKGGGDLATNEMDASTSPDQFTQVRLVATVSGPSSITVGGSIVVT